MNERELTRRRLLELGLALPPVAAAARQRRRVRPRRRCRSAAESDADAARCRRPDAGADRRPLLHRQSPRRRSIVPAGATGTRLTLSGRVLTHSRQACPSRAHRLLAVRRQWRVRQQRLSLSRPSVHRRSRPVLPDHGRPRCLSGEDEAHPRQGAGAAALGPDDAALLPRRRRQPSRRHLYAGVPGDALARGRWAARRALRLRARAVGRLPSRAWARA